MTTQPAAAAGAFPVPRACPFSLPPEYERLRTGRRAVRARMAGGNSAWLVARHEDARKVLSDPRMSVDRRREGFPRFAPVTEEERQASFRAFRPPMNWMDPPEHTAARRSVRAEFSPGRTEALRPRVQEIVDRRLDLMADAPRPVDLVRELAAPVPSLVICELLGVPYSVHGHFEERTGRMFSHATPAAGGHQPAAQRGQPGDGLALAEAGQVRVRVVLQGGCRHRRAERETGGQVEGHPPQSIPPRFGSTT